MDQIKAECHYVIEPENQILHNGDTLDGDWPAGEETKITSSPFTSVSWINYRRLKNRCLKKCSFNKCLL